MKRVWLICALAAMCAGCVAKTEQVSVPATATARSPLPLFHPDYKAGSPWHEYSESTEANLTKFAELVRKVVHIRVRKRDFVAEAERVWLEITDPAVLSDVRWAFSGELMETRRPGFSFVTAQFVFGLSDGTEIRLEDVGHYYSVSFPGATWSLILATDNMRAAMKPVCDRLDAGS